MIKTSAALRHVIKKKIPCGKFRKSASMGAHTKTKYNDCFYLDTLLNRPRCNLNCRKHIVSSFQRSIISSKTLKIVIACHGAKKNTLFNFG